MKGMKFRKKIQIRPAFDRRNPNPHENYGIHGCDMIFTLIGKKGAVTFVLYTNWHLPHVVEELEMRGDRMKPLPADIRYHSPLAMYEEQEPRKEVCEYIGVPCYQAGSACDADKFYQEILEKGSKGLWRKMMKYYERIFKESVSE